MVDSPKKASMSTVADDDNESLMRSQPEEKGVQEISVSNYIKSDSFIVDMERFSAFSHLMEKDNNANSRITLQRNLSRKGSLQKTILNPANEKGTTSPRASLLGVGSTPEKPVLLTVGTADHPTPQVHNQITIVAGNGGATATATATESKVGGGGRRFTFRRSSLTIDPRRILIFFATLSSMGTILLIYFTLSMTKLNGEDNTTYN